MSAVTREAVIEQIRISLEFIQPGAIDGTGKQLEVLNFGTDLSLDSLDIINILFELDTKFQVMVPTDFEGLMVVGSLADYVTDNAGK